MIKQKVIFLKQMPNDNDLYFVYNDISNTEFDRIKWEMNTAALKVNYRLYF